MDAYPADTNQPTRERLSRLVLLVLLASLSSQSYEKKLTNDNVLLRRSLLFDKRNNVLNFYDCPTCFRGQDQATNFFTNYLTYADE